MFSGEEGFLGTGGGAAEGRVLRCSMEVEGAISNHSTHQAGVTALGVSQGGRVLMQGFSNGMIRVSEAAEDTSSITGMRAACDWYSSPHVDIFQKLGALTPSLITNLLEGKDCYRRHLAYAGRRFYYFLLLSC